MHSTKELIQMEFAVKQLIKDNGTAFAAGYLSTVIVNMLADVKGKRKQQKWVRQLEHNNELFPVAVKNLMTGDTVLIQRRQVGTCTDPSTERYWSM